MGNLRHADGFLLSWEGSEDVVTSLFVLDMSW